MVLSGPTTQHVHKDEGEEGAKMSFKIAENQIMYKFEVKKYIKKLNIFAKQKAYWFISLMKFGGWIFFQNHVR